MYKSKDGSRRPVGGVCCLQGVCVYEVDEIVKVELGIVEEGKLWSLGGLEREWEVDSFCLFTYVRGRMESRELREKGGVFVCSNNGQPEGIMQHGQIKKWANEWSKRKK